MPKVHLLGTIDLAFSIEYDGLLINELNEAWHKESLASVLMIKNFNSVIGVYFDRNLKLIENEVRASESFLFVVDREIKTFAHIPEKTLKFEFKKNSGIFIGNGK